MRVFAIFEDPNINIGEAFLISLIAILIVFAVLVLLIFISWLFQKGIDKVTASTNILPKEENKILADDEDAVAALLAATIDFYKETGKEPEVKSITRIED